MKTVDLGAMVVGYNFVIGILIMLSSQKVGTYAGYVSKGYRPQIVRLTHVSTFTFGACVAAVSGFIYVVWYLLKLGF